MHIISLMRNALMHVIEFACHPLCPQFVTKWRNEKYIAAGRRRGATHVITLWDTTDLEVCSLKYVMPGQDADAIFKRIGKDGPIIAGEILKIEAH